MNESGQTLVIILLVVATSLLVGAGVATRSTFLIQQSTFSEEANQALHFSESCAEEALRMIKGGEITRGDVASGNVVEYCCDVADAGDCRQLVDCDRDDYDCSFSVSELGDEVAGIVEKDDAVELNLENASTSGCEDITLYWCLEAENCPSEDIGLEVSVVYNNGSEWLVWKQIYGDSSYGFASHGGEAEFDGVDYDYHQSIDLFADLPDDVSEVKLMRLTPRFKSFHIGIASCGSLGFQGFDINTEGWFGRSTKKVRVTRSEPALPPIFDYVLFSGSEDAPLEKR
ncbi:MAG: hypothetical protein U9M98_03100 [Patescibacteria group bacterium]|nr:hypothetical protein [Patescibacteria group bacterium]